MDEAALIIAIVALVLSVIVTGFGMALQWFMFRASTDQLTNIGKESAGISERIARSLGEIHETTATTRGAPSRQGVRRMWEGVNVRWPLRLVLHSRPDGPMTRYLLLVVFVIVAVMGAVACDPGHPVTYENQTDMAVEVFINGKFSASLEPMKKEKFELIEFDEVTFEARDSDGRVIYSETFTWEELKQAGWRIVIEEPASSRPAAPVEAR